jgi:membrane dipeptidase
MRLIDLHCNWALQYACETTQYNPLLYTDIGERLGQVEGYLSDTSVSVLTCGRRAEDWASLRDPWATLYDMIARYEAEFPGRILIGPEDVRRWAAEPPDGICWGMIGVEGFDFLVRETADLDRLPGLFERGVRVFQLVETSASLLGGSAAPGDHRGLSGLGTDFLATLLALAPPAGHPGPRPIVDLADLNATSLVDVLQWVEDDSSRCERLLLLRSHGGAALFPPDLRRIRTLGGLVGLSVGPPFSSSTLELRLAIEFVASIPFEGRVGFEGIGIGTDALSVVSSLEGLENVARIIAWLEESYDSAAASLVAHGNARKLLDRAVGAVHKAALT